jgi:putative DNA primase/helicase
MIGKLIEEVLCSRVLEQVCLRSTPVDGAALLDSIKRVFRRYIVLPKSADVALSLWVLHAWTMDAGDISPFMVLVSPTKRCGKTSVLVLLFYLTPKSELASNITAAALFRYIEAVRPTLLIDEADSFVKDNDELRGVLNSGHTKVAANIIRNVEVKGEHKARRFSTWTPKAIATIRKLADTLGDRSVIVTLQRKPRDAKLERLRRRDTEEFKHLRSQAARWAAGNLAAGPVTMVAGHTGAHRHHPGLSRGSGVLSPLGRSTLQLRSTYRRPRRQGGGTFPR